MWPYHPELMATPVPRYTSYPTALTFDERVGSRELVKAIDAVAPGSAISLYIHIPYCEQICWYCGCNTGAANRRNRLARYLDALSGEIRSIGRRLTGRACVDRIAFGGGSPNAIPPADFARLSALLRKEFELSDDVGISVELDPRALTHEWVKALRKEGVTRVSMGVQSFSPAIQARIGRIQPEWLVHDALEMLRGEGIGSINFDLMYGLPGQSCEDLEQSIDIALGMRPSRIALFGFAHHPEMFPRQRQVDATLLPGPSERFFQAAIGHDRLVEGGYIPIGFDHFALPEDGLARAVREHRVRRNFQGFTDDQSDVLIGMGASAISQFPDLIVQNEKNPGRYRSRIWGEGSAAARGVVRLPGDQARAEGIERLLCSGSTTVKDPADRLRLRRLLGRYEERGLVIWQGPRVEITQAGRPYSRWIASSLERLEWQARQADRHAAL